MHCESLNFMAKKKVRAQCVTKVVNGTSQQCGWKSPSIHNPVHLWALLCVEPQCVGISFKDSVCLWTIIIVLMWLGLRFLSRVLKTHRYIPLFSSGGLIRKAQAILQDLPQGLTNLLSYVFVTSRTKHLIAPFFFSNSELLSFKAILSSLPSLFSAESELAFRCFRLFSITGQSVCVSGESICCILGLSVAAGDALRPGARPFSSQGQAFLEALRCKVVDHRVQAAIKAGETQGDGVKCSGKALHCAVSQRLGPHQGIEEEDRVIRNEADDENAQMNNNHPQDASLVITAMTSSHWATQGPQDKWGTYQVSQQGDEEANNLGWLKK